MRGGFVVVFFLSLQMEVENEISVLLGGGTFDPRSKLEIVHAGVAGDIKATFPFSSWWLKERQC